MATELHATLEKLVMPIIIDFGMELVELEFKREGRSWALRLFIDKPGGVTLDDCAEVSREIGAILEVEDPIDAPYRLEVSSPGIDRPLKKVADYERFAGQRVKIKTRSLFDPDDRGHRRKTFVGELMGIEGGVVRLRQMDKRGGEIGIAMDEIDKANIEPVF